MKKKPSLGYSLALYLSTVMWIFGMVGIFGVCVGLGIDMVREYQYQKTIDQLDLSHEEYLQARADRDEAGRWYQEFYHPIEALPHFPATLFAFGMIGGIGYRIRKEMGEPVSFTELLR